MRFVVRHQDRIERHKVIIVIFALLQFSFKDRVEPFYCAMVSLSLRCGLGRIRIVLKHLHFNYLYRKTELDNVFNKNWEKFDWLGIRQGCNFMFIRNHRKK